MLVSNPPVQQIRSSSRGRSWTEKGLEMREQEAKKQEKAFYKGYNSWKERAKETRSRLKMFCSRENLEKIQQDIQGQHNSVYQHYEPILHNHATSPDIANRMDACAALTAEISDLVSKRLETIDEEYNEELVKERVRQVLNKDEFGSIFGCTITNTVISESSQGSVNELMQRQNLQQKEIEMQLRLQEERNRLHQLQVDKEVKVAAARVKQALCDQHVTLAQAIADPLSTHRLPLPEPTIFSGDPLKFIDWKMSFMALIDRKPLPPGEKMFYLKNYLVGEARKAVEGYFYRNSEDAYQGAWKVLQDRYGNPFILQRAFRDKLQRCPKIEVNDPLALRDFTDFLQGCVKAIPHVKGLAILNDCEENHKLLKKLWWKS
ncbi:hypothetical protein M9458_057576 [Cirrhinus mrigala]|uniref:Uncharacterized protein n=1 Tax=Cirrhinus mrigala TaxID=683832 RepID=A0ABD0MDK0_CIRMR